MGKEKTTNSAPKGKTKKKVSLRLKWTDDIIEKLADELVAWIQVDSNFWLGFFAFENGFHRNRFSDFAKKNEKFAVALEIAKQGQENKILMAGLKKELDSKLVYSALKNTAGWRDYNFKDEGEDRAIQTIIVGGKEANKYLEEEFKNKLQKQNTDGQGHGTAIAEE